MNLTGKTILVTGGAGFIGSHAVDLLSKKNHVIVYDNFSSNVISLSDLSRLRNLKIIKGDILDQKKLEKAMNRVDIVFHFAVACVRLSLSDEAYVHEVNTTGTLSTLLAARNAGVKRFIYISSSEVYGTTHGKRISETHPIEPKTVYGMSKYQGELYAKLFNETEGLPTIIIRPFNSYGPREHFDGVYGEVIPRFAIQALNGKQPTIFGTGKQTRDFTYVTDTAKGIMLAAQNDHLVGDVINIAHGKDVSINAIAQKMCLLSGHCVSPVYRPMRPHDVDRLAADTKKAQSLLHFSAETSIDEGLRLYIQWLKHTYPDQKELMPFVPDTNWVGTP